MRKEIEIKTSSIYNHKRFKIVLLGIILCAALSILGMVINNVAVVTVATGGIPSIVVAYVAGDSYRQSTFDYNYPSRVNNDSPHNITE